MATCKIHLTEMLVTHGKMQHTSDKNVKYTWQNVTYICQKCLIHMETCNIHLAKMLDTHGKMKHTSDKNVKYTWKNVRYI